MVVALIDVGGSLVQLIVGASADLSDSYAAANRISLSVGVPLDEWLDGPGLSREVSFTAGWQIGF